jgi:hypothetical protein
MGRKLNQVVNELLRAVEKNVEPLKSIDHVIAIVVSRTDGEPAVPERVVHHYHGKQGT